MSKVIDWGRAVQVTAYFNLEKGYLWEQGVLEGIELTDEARHALNYFGYEHEFTAEINPATGEYIITHLDGKKVGNLP